MPRTKRRQKASENNRPRHPSKIMLINGKEFSKKEWYKTIYRDWTRKTPIGFCYLDSHKGYVTFTQVKKHKCFAKNCPFLKLNLSHEFNKKYLEKYKITPKCKLCSNNTLEREA